VTIPELGADISGYFFRQASEVGILSWNVHGPPVEDRRPCISCRGRDRVPSERFTGLAAVLEAVRTDEGITQPLLVDRVGLGRSVVAQRVAELESTGLLASKGLGPSTGGRAPRLLRLRAEAGFVLGVDIATNELLLGVADLAGNLVETRHAEMDVSDGPEATFELVERLGDDLLDATGARENLWSVGLGMPGPVAHDDHGTTSMPTLPDWDRFPTVARLAERWSAPVWMDNRVNLSALGERRVNPLAAASQQTVYLGGGEALGAAIVVDGRIYRGAHGLAGEIGHLPVPGAGDVVCACGNRGCLDAVAGRQALIRDGRLLAETGQSPALAAVLAETGTLRPVDITVAADKSDPAARALLHRSASILGGTLATLVSVFNPDLVIVGGGMARARAHLIAAIREAIYRGALPAATHDLRIEPSALDMEVAGLTGALQFAIDEIFAPEQLAQWLDRRSPAHSAPVVEAATA
jgi:predicted NBD/HSP70 family sugar kinase